MDCNITQRCTLAEFVHRVRQDFNTPKHLSDIYSTLEEALDNTSARMLFSMPPRFGKTSTFAAHLPAWYLGGTPTHKIIVAVSSEAQATRLCMDMAALLTSSEYKTLYPDLVIDFTNSKPNMVRTVQGGWVLFAWPCYPLLGRTADLVIVDDVAGHKDSRSAIAWFTHSVRCRVMLGSGSVVVVETVEPEKGLIPHLLETASGDSAMDQYVLHSFPAIVNEGEENERSLWPERWTLEELLRVRESLPTLLWETSYQQKMP